MGLEEAKQLRTLKWSHLFIQSSKMAQSSVLLLNYYGCKCDKFSEEPMLQNKNDLILNVCYIMSWVKSVTLSLCMRQCLSNKSLVQLWERSSDSQDPHKIKACTVPCCNLCIWKVNTAGFHNKLVGRLAESVSSEFDWESPPQ